MLFHVFTTIRFCSQEIYSSEPMVQSYFFHADQFSHLLHSIWKGKKIHSVCIKFFVPFANAQRIETRQPKQNNRIDSIGVYACVIENKERYLTLLGHLAKTAIELRAY